MKYLLSLAILLGGCTKANPNALPINGGDIDMAVGTGGGSGGGGGGGAGGSGGGVDLATGPVDLAARPPDMTSFQGVICGTKTCSGNTPDCCVNNAGRQCIDGTTGNCSGGSTPALFGCDGPEDCKAGLNDTCCLSFTGGGGASNGSSCVPGVTCGQGQQMCHAVGDCPANQGYVGCCAIPTTQYRRCSKTPCQ